MSVFRLNALRIATAKISREKRIPSDVGSLDGINQLFWRISASKGKPSAQQAVDGSGPCRKLLFSGRSVHLWREAVVQVPLGRKTVRLGKGTGRAGRPNRPRQAPLFR